MQEEPVVPVRKGMAIASLVLGILSIPTCGLLGIGSLIGIVLGVLALNNVNKNPKQYGGKGLAIGGIITSIAGLLLIAVNAAIVIPQLNKMLKIGRESAAVETLRTIHQAEASFFASNNRFGTLKELAAIEGQNIKVVNGRTVAGFVYTEAEISDKAFCIQATRASDSMGRRDFNIMETGVIHYVEAKQPTIVPCGQGTPIQ
jgi:hypothetical protein